MAKHRSHSIEFKRQVAQEFIAGETLHALSSRHDVSPNLIRIWVRKERPEELGNRPALRPRANDMPREGLSGTAAAVRERKRRRVEDASA